ncbi:MAG: type IX secretion system membrane protein PorP/SprF [Chitinophagia bacterium]|nr:type IX secretion system membrane protein PorP/SprF [Chitinophagia bacterium]
MRNWLVSLVFFVAGLVNSYAQSMHFSQYYNAPQLLNPANTALMPEYDYRIGANYRNQWAVLPVPFTTYSAFGDFKVGAKNDRETPNWLGIGGAIYSDKAGNGNLSLLQFQGSMAYHLHLSNTSLLSFGASAASVQRTVNLDALTFDAQWDGFSFNGRLPNGESLGVIKTKFTSVNAGANVAFFPNEAVYIKLGVAMNNLNQPVETFYNGTNQVQTRALVNLDMVFRTGPDFIINPSAYYSTQSNASELVFGTLAHYRIAKVRDAVSSQLLLGAYHRLGDAMIGAVGYEYGGLQVLASYDFTVSALAPYNGTYGALELSLIYGSTYFKNQGLKKMYGCPRFN